MGKASNRSEIKLKPVFEYTDYRLFLSDYYKHSKATKRSFSFRLFSAKCGFKSPNFLQLVMQGKSSLSSVSVEKVISGMQLSKEEGDFFRNLVAFNDARDPERRAHFARNLIQSRSYKEIFQLSEAQFKYLGTWYFPVIRSVIGLGGSSSDASWIAERMKPKLTEEQVKRAIDEMFELGLIAKDKNGRLSQVDRMVGTPGEIASSFAYEYHKQMLEKSIESMKRFSREERHLTGSTVALNGEAMIRAKELAEQFRKDIVELASRCESADSIYQVNFQIFPLFQAEKEGK